MKRRKMQSRYFSMVTPALGGRELKWKTTHTTKSTKSETGSSQTGGDPVCILGLVCL